MEDNKDQPTNSAKEIKPFRLPIPIGGLIYSLQIEKGGLLNIQCVPPKAEDTENIDFIGVGQPVILTGELTLADNSNEQTILNNLVIEADDGGNKYKAVPQIFLEEDESGNKIRKIRYDRWTSLHGSKKPTTLAIERSGLDNLIIKITRNDLFSTKAA